MKTIIISDTHSKHDKLILDGCDLIIHCGDFSHNEMQLFDFIEWFSKQNSKYKILIAGNHDLYVDFIRYNEMKLLCELHNIIYLQDSFTILEGIKFYGSPMSNEFGVYPFMTNEMKLKMYWDLIPEDTDVLITHGPAYMVGDIVKLNEDENINVGSISLSERIKNLNIKYHFFGHIHLCGGSVYEQNGYIAYNASSSYEHYEKEYGKLKKPTTFDINIINN